MLTTRDHLWRCWGKTDQVAITSDKFHPAVYHMLDVGHVAQLLLGQKAPRRWQRMLAHALDADVRQLETWLPYILAMHDIGKISVAFQVKSQDQVNRLRAENFEMNIQSPALDVPHAILSQALLNPEIGAFKIAECPKLTRAWSEAMGGHHGRFVARDALKQARAYFPCEAAAWADLRNMADQVLRMALLSTNRLPEVIHISTAIIALTGFTVLCDWIGSDARYFVSASEVGWEDYITLSRNRAEIALRQNGLLASTASAVSAGVAALFDDLGAPRPLQYVIDEIPDAVLERPVLAIIEAPTGEGKTEAALALARRIAMITGTDELFYALPTMATSNQMFGRLNFHLHERLGLDTEVKLAHGQAFLVEKELRAEAPSSGITSLRNGDDRSQRDPLEWFSGKKRTLLAPFGVGTIDQAELAALNAKHAALRMIGLAGKVVIVDEVHAYDVYMTTVISQLLGWLAAMDTSVILLSATLPNARRTQLLAAYDGRSVSAEMPRTDEYPAVMLMQQRDAESSPMTIWQPEHRIDVWQPNRIIELSALHYGDKEAAAKGRWLLEAVREGGCACWITNTVKRAQDVFEELGKLKEVEKLDLSLDLLHSQLPLEERQQREIALAEVFGRNGEKTGKRPPSGIVIGTQVLEQSLDLDFDLMVSDLAPIDLLLQRAGRLHRHKRSRPIRHELPRLYLNYEEDDEAEMRITSDGTVYAEYIQRLTHRALRDRQQITLPDDYRKLVEAVYADIAPSTGDPLYRAWQALDADAKNAVAEAELRLLPLPHPRDSFATTVANKIKFEESETRADWLVAKTRLGEKTLNVIPLERTGDLARLPDGATVSVDTEASRAVQLRLLRRHLRISRQAAIEALAQEAAEHPTGLFKKSDLLKDYVPLWLTGGKAELPHSRGRLIFELHPQLGLRIIQERAHDDNK